MRESKIKFTRAPLTPDLPTLAAAIARLDEQEAAAQLRQGEAVLSAARTEQSRRAGIILFSTVPPDLDRF